MNDRFHYEFYGMDPSEWTENYIESEFEALLSIAPKNCHLKLKVERFGKNGIEGKLITYSNGETFIVNEHNHDIATLTKSLKKKMKAKLHKWRDVHLSHQHGRAS